MAVHREKAKAKVSIAIWAALGLAVTACGGAPETGVSIEPGFVRTPSAGAPATAGYLTITSAEDDRLLRVATDLARTVEIHTVENNNGVMAMRPVDGIDLPAGEAVALAPGGYHLMIMGPAAEMATAETVTVTLTFEKAGSQVIELPVRRTAP